MNRTGDKILAGGAGVAIAAVGLALTVAVILYVEVVEVFPDTLSFIILPAGGILSLAIGVGGGLFVYRWRGSEEQSDG